MAALTQLLASHGCILVLDAASTTVQVGLYRPAANPVWKQSPEEAGQSLFANTESCLREAGCNLDDVGAFVFCEGPGSMLGIRTAAMAIRTWQSVKHRPAYRYQSLVLLAVELRRASATLPFSVVADARRDTWHCVSVPDPAGAGPTLRRVNAGDLAASGETLYQPASFRAWVSPPRATLNCEYEAARLFAAHAHLDLLTATDAPDAFQYEAPVYKKWSAQVHRLATTARP
jgi:tRNA threonylcarbamoyladenosine biosynthesis protein TsaB